MMMGKMCLTQKTKNSFLGYMQASRDIQNQLEDYRYKKEEMEERKKNPQTNTSLEKRDPKLEKGCFGGIKGDFPCAKKIGSRFEGKISPLEHSPSCARLISIAHG